ncbi:MAG: proteasome accessory factor PafA2 family protein, partial [Candidatus Sungbacteria bacterium]|nr:proteasome accessory factor PafA2 family protein [Candidatus Sungbacteria bacterium]
MSKHIETAKESFVPRESKAIPKMIGIENEYGCLLQNGSRKDFHAEAGGVPFVMRYDPEWLLFERSGAWDPTARLGGSNALDAQAHSYFKDAKWQLYMNFLMPNGARFYLDMTHPEICIPLCRNPLEALLHDRACELMMNRIREKHLEVCGDEYRLYKNNTACGDEEGRRTIGNNGVSYSTHENYLVSRNVPIMELAMKELPFLVLRTVLFGAGKVWEQNCGNTADYQLSQRADFFGEAVGVHTIGTSRPIKNLRDRPYANREQFRRVHVISGDANMCEVAEFLKLGLTSLLFM